MGSGVQDEQNKGNKTGIESMHHNELFNQSKTQCVVLWWYEGDALRGYIECDCDSLLCIHAFVNVQITRRAASGGATVARWEAVWDEGTNIYTHITLAPPTQIVQNIVIKHFLQTWKWAEIVHRGDKKPLKMGLHKQNRHKCRQEPWCDNEVVGCHKSAHVHKHSRRSSTRTQRELHTHKDVIISAPARTVR